MGLGLGLGVAAMAQMRAGGGVDSGRAPSLGGVPSATVDLMGSGAMASLYGSVSVFVLYICSLMHFIIVPCMCCCFCLCLMSVANRPLVDDITTSANNVCTIIYRFYHCATVDNDTGCVGAL